MLPVLDTSRLRARSVEGSLLVIDRLNGRWLLLDAAWLPIYELLGSPDQGLAAPLRQRVQALREELARGGLGREKEGEDFESLNTVIVKLTNACNLACTYCYDFETLESAQRIDVDAAVAAIAQALDLCRDKLCIILHGGEPMLRWAQIETIVEAGERLAREKGKAIRFSGQTNMTRVTDRVVAFSLAHRIAWGVSLDGPPHLHDVFRIGHRGQGSFDLFLRNYERYPGFVRACGVMTTVTTANAAHLVECARFFQRLGMASWDWSLFQPIGRGRETGGKFAVPSEHIVQGWAGIFDLLEAGEFDGFPVYPVKKYLDNFIAGPGGNMCMRPKCGAARDLLSLSADGRIEACDCIDPLGPLAGLGRLGETTLEEARHSELAVEIRSRDLSESACADCLWFGVCGGTCLAHAGALDAVWEESCALAKFAFERIAGSLARSDSVVRYLKSVA